MTEEEKKAIEYIKSELQDEKEARNDYQSLTGLYGNLEIEIILNLIQKKDTEINKLKCKIKNSIYILKHNINQFEEYSDSELEEWLNNFDKCAIKKGGK